MATEESYKHVIEPWQWRGHMCHRQQKWNIGAVQACWSPRVLAHVPYAARGAAGFPTHPAGFWFRFGFIFHVSVSLIWKCND